MKVQNKIPPSNIVSNVSDSGLKLFDKRFHRTKAESIVCISTLIISFLVIISSASFFNYFNVVVTILFNYFIDAFQFCI